MVYYKGLKIESEPFTEEQLDSALKKVDFVYHLNSASKKTIKKWMKQHSSESFWKEEIIYIHRYPSTKDTLIGIKRLESENIDYYI